MANQPLVGVVLGSANDVDQMQPCLEKLKSLGIAHEMRVLSAHRTPDDAAAFAKGAAEAGFRVLIAAAGMAAHLPGVLAAFTPLPVIGVPLDGPLGGLEALYAIVQMPGGVPVATVAVGKAGPVNAAILATQIIGAGDPEVRQRIAEMKQGLREKGLANDERVRSATRWTP